MYCETSGISCGNEHEIISNVWCQQLGNATFDDIHATVPFLPIAIVPFYVAFKCTVTSWFSFHVISVFHKHWAACFSCCLQGINISI